MKSLVFLEHVAHDRKAAIYTAAHDGKLRNFVYHEELGECRETFSRLFQDVQKGEIGVVMTPDAACCRLKRRRVGWRSLSAPSSNTESSSATTATIWSMICASKRMRRGFGICIPRGSTH
ncbi:MAG TPA: hypothetical protein VF043_04810 [Ktedonobacteraceae bacterium]